MSKEIWVRTDGPESKEKRKGLFTAALEAGADGVIIRPSDGDFSSLGKIDTMVSESGQLRGSMNGSVVSLRSPDDQKKALDLVGRTDLVVLDASDWSVIPLENMIAKFGGRTKVFACASTVEQAELYLTTLEKGVDGIVVDDAGIVSAIRRVLAGHESMDLCQLTVTDVKNIGMGDRVCVDTCTMMSPGEGMMVGSQSSCLFLIQSESEDVGYVNARPFRVNAGAVHAYVMVPGGGTRYLSELKSGDRVASICSDGTVRTVSVGRCKIEQRPLLMVEAQSDGRTYSTILQNAETVKMIGPEGSISVAQLKKGDKVYAKLESGGRHFGMKIKETIREI